MNGDCRDPFHTEADAPNETYEIALPGMVFQGHRCLTCGFESVRLEQYEVASKPCPSCHLTFEGMADEPRELCDSCFAARLPASIAELVASQQGDQKS